MGTAYDDGNHAGQTFLPSKVPGHDEDENCDRNCSNCQTKFNILDIHYDNHKLDGETEEEEEVEFEEGDIDL